MVGAMHKSAYALLWLQQQSLTHVLHALYWTNKQLQHSTEAPVMTSCLAEGAPADCSFSSAQCTLVLHAKWHITFPAQHLLSLVRPDMVCHPTAYTSSNAA